MGVLKKIAGMAAVALLSPVLAAQPAIYQNQTLTIPQGRRSVTAIPSILKTFSWSSMRRGFSPSPMPKSVRW